MRAMLLSTTALAACLPLMMMADAGSGGGASQTYDLADAIKLLDPKSDADWNKGGQPDLDRLKALTGKPVSRADVVAAAPDLQRSNAPELKAAAAPAKEPDKPVKEASGVGGEKVPEVTEGKQLVLSQEQWDQLMNRFDAQEKTIADLQDQLSERGPERGDVHDATKVLDQTPAPDMAVLDPNDPNALKRPPAAPTPNAMPASGSRAGMADAQDVDTDEIVKARGHRLRWGVPVKNVEMVALALGQYDGALVRQGQRFMFSGIPGKWMAHAGDPNLNRYITGEATPPHVQEVENRE